MKFIQFSCQLYIIKKLKADLKEKKTKCKYFEC